MPRCVHDDRIIKFLKVVIYLKMMADLLKDNVYKLYLPSAPQYV